MMKVTRSKTPKAGGRRIPLVPARRPAPQTPPGVATRTGGNPVFSKLA